MKKEVNNPELHAELQQDLYDALENLFEFETGTSLISIEKLTIATFVDDAYDFVMLNFSKHLIKKDETLTTNNEAL